VSNWRKSSHSFANGNCAEVAAWRTSTASANNGACAEVGQDGTVILMRDSKDPDGAVLVFGPVAWRTFALQIKQRA